MGPPLQNLSWPANPASSGGDGSTRLPSSLGWVRYGRLPDPSSTVSQSAQALASLLGFQAEPHLHQGLFWLLGSQWTQTPPLLKASMSHGSRQAEGCPLQGFFQLLQPLRTCPRKPMLQSACAVTCALGQLQEQTLVEGAHTELLF